MRWHSDYLLADAQIAQARDSGIVETPVDQCSLSGFATLWPWSANPGGGGRKAWRGAG